MSDEAAVSNDSVRIAYTGTRSPDIDQPGLDLLHLPMLASEPVDFNPQIIAELLKDDVQVVFFSTRAVDAIADSPLLQHFEGEHIETWAVGAKTSEHIREALAAEAHVPERQDFEGICDALEGADDRKVVVFGLEDAPRDLGRALEDRVVHEFPVYRTFPRLHPELGAVLREFDPNWIAFTSPRGLEAFASQADQFDFPWRTRKTAAIGPTTGDALRALGLEPDVQLEDPGRNRLIEAILKR
jgi:uroporphyrinogen-III synthase